MSRAIVVFFLGNQITTSPLILLVPLLRPKGAEYISWPLTAFKTGLTYEVVVTNLQT